MKNIFQITLLFFVVNISNGQNKSKIHFCFAFYNCENLYDTIDNPNTIDEDFTPKGDKAYTTLLYQEKLEHIGEALDAISNNNIANQPIAIGLAEIENDTVLNDLIHKTKLHKYPYRFIHFDSKDRRGVDVAFLYNPTYVKIVSAVPIFIPIPSGSKLTHATRDILHITTMIGNERFHFFVNHWPSRLGGSEVSYPARAAAAGILKKHVAAIQSTDSLSKIIIMGDFNDNPSDRSINVDLLGDSTVQLYNTLEPLWKKRIGTLAYQDAWGLFDQIIISKNNLSKDKNGIKFWYSEIFNPYFLQESFGKYKGYPKRFFGQPSMSERGYSDHFPVIIHFKGER